MSFTKAFGMVAAIAIVGFVTEQVTAATIEWDAGGDGVSTFQEANWVVTDNTGSPGLTVNADPPGGFVNPETDILADMIVAGSGTAGGPAGAGGHVDLGPGLSLTVLDDASFNVRINDGSSNRGIRGISGGPAETVSVEDNASLTTQFLLNIDASFSGSSTIRFGGGGVGTLNNSTADLAPDWTGSITWLNFAGVSGSSLIDRITVGGQPAVEGVNVQVVGNGANGAILTLVAPVPEPSTSLLIALSATCVGWRRRK